MSRICVCGKHIIGRSELCNECLAIYGSNRSEWPKWLVFMVNDMARERGADKRICRNEVSFCDIESTKFD